MYEIKPSLVKKEDILSKVSQEQIWEYYLGFKIKPGKLFISPLREESDPSANLFYAKSGDLLLKDFGGITTNIWKFIQDRYSLTFKEAIQKVASDLCIDIGIRYDRKYTPTVPKRRDFTSIQIKITNWNDEYLSYWSDYYISLDTLQEYKVVPITDLWINNNYISLKGISYSYEFGKGYRKIYSPFDPKFKFVSNVLGEMFSGFDQLPLLNDLLIITKSHKDVMVLKELGYYSIAPQGEGNRIEPDFINKLNKRFDKIILNYDNDKVGRDYSSKLAETFNLEELFVPEEDDIKDISDYIKKYGHKQTLNNIKKWLNTK